MEKNQLSLGAFYSPEPYARVLVRWALNGVAQKVLDPSYGGCAFLRVALDELRVLGDPAPERSIFGTDIDGDTAKWTSHLVSTGVPPENLRATDFLTLVPGEDLPRVPAVVGNPPYVRHHRLASEFRDSGFEAMTRSGLNLNGRANLWAYFVIHATQFLEVGGRMAMLLPGSVLDADYALPVIEHLASTFKEVMLVRLGERVFQDAQEETVVLLASGAGEGVATVRIAERNNLRDLTRLLAGEQMNSVGVPYRRSDWRLDLLDRDGRDVFQTLISKSDSALVPLGDLAEIRIGTVTGANDFFMLSLAEAEDLGASDLVHGMVARTAWLTGPTFTKAQLDQLTSAGLRTKVLALPQNFDLIEHPRIMKKILSGEELGINLRHKCQRDPWWALKGLSVPDAFLPYMGSAFKGIVGNSAHAASTNAIHNLNWKKDRIVGSAANVILSSWSSISALSAEINGRSYGGGVLKIEPSGAKKLLVLNGRQASLHKGLQVRVAPRGAADAFMATELGLTAAEQSVISRNLERMSKRRVLDVFRPSSSSLSVSAV